MIRHSSRPPTPPDPIWAAVDSLFPRMARFAYTDELSANEGDLSDELAFVRNAVASRQREFAAGRRCARRALEDLGVLAGAIPIGADRSPVWPAGIVGSITHCRGFAGAAVARSSELGALGFDAEVAEPLDGDIVSTVCVAREIEWASSAPVPSSGDWLKVFFSAKEAIHKCIGPLTGVMLDFTDVEVTIDAKSGSFSAREAKGSVSVSETNPFASLRATVAQIEGRIVFTDTLILTTAYIPAGQAANRDS